MFSYLHGVRPSNRRSAAPDVAVQTPARTTSFYHDSPSSPGFRFDLSPREGSHRSNDSTEEVIQEPGSPVSPDPPTLPPIPRITSQRNSVSSQSDAAKDVERSSTVDNHTEDTSLSTSSVIQPSQVNPTQLSSAVEKEHIKPQANDSPRRTVLPVMEAPQRAPPPPPSEDSRRTSSRPKRPIDLAFENMRSYTEPPFRQSILMPPGSGYVASQPYHQTPPIASARPTQFAYHTHGHSTLQSRALGQGSLSNTASASKQSSQTFGTRTSMQAQAPNFGGQDSQPSAPAGLSQESLVPGPKQLKTKLNLRNPLSLLARRRSSQAVTEAYNQNEHVPAAPLRDDFDPRIRGKVVHDFSAPRQGRSQGLKLPNALKNIPETENYLINPKRPPKMAQAPKDSQRPGSAERDHAPVFKEQFDDGNGAGTEGPAKRKSTAFMLNMSGQQPLPQPDRSSLPAFARNLPANFASSLENLRQSSPLPSPKAPLQVVPESSDIKNSSMLKSPASPLQQPANPSPPKSPPVTRSRGSSINDQLSPGIGSPKRFKSNSSRFSFDLAGVGSAAQEKLLEEKHRQHASRKQRDSVLSLEDGEEMDDDNGYDDYMQDEMNDEGFEEQIPGVNADEDDEDEADDDGLSRSHLPVAQQALDNFHFASPNKSSFEGTTSPVSTGLTSPGTPRDFTGQAIGFAVTKFPGGVQQVQIAGTGGLRPRSTPGDKSSSRLSSEPLQRVVSSESNLANLPKSDAGLMNVNLSPGGYEDDDMYFQDGIDDEDLDIQGEETFDESVFDDSSNGLYGLPLRDRTLRPLDPEVSSKDYETKKNAPLDLPANSQAESMLSSQPSVKSSGGLSAELRDALTDLAQPNHPVFSPTAGLTQDNLAAYSQNALAMATIQAAQNGAFDRPNSSASKGAESDPDGVPLDMTRTGSQISQNLLNMPVDLNFGDDGEDDDDIVAAANAEALENDDDGFYGQEFGFFAGPASGSSQTEYANGGYFGARSLAEGVHRSHSGRDAGFQEPSLTPITERSEWSNRNSTISLAHWGRPLSTPGFGSEVQLANMMNLPEEGMSLEALMKLRRNAFGGGSSTSLHSSGNSNNSPVMSLAPGMTASSQQSNLNVAGTSSQNLSSSFNSELDSSNGPASSQADSDPSPSGDSPTITFSPASNTGLTMAPTPQQQQQQSMGPPPVPVPSNNNLKRETPPPQPSGPPPPPPIPVQAQDIPPPKRRSGTITKDRSSWAPGHSRNSSGAESVSYKEEGGKWILEKRRVGDGGEVEIVGRTFVEGGRI